MSETASHFQSKGVLVSLELLSAFLLTCTQISSFFFVSLCPFSVPIPKQVSEQISDIAYELHRLSTLTGKSFVRQLELITQYKGFIPIEGESSIFHIGMEQDKDYQSLIDAARKAVDQGYSVYILPNPRNCRTADFIFKKKSSYTMYDLKTVSGKGSVGTQLLDSIGQSNRVLLNITSDYNARLLAADIRTYFESNRQAVEVLLFKGKKTISVNRYAVQSPLFHKQFRKKYEK